MEARKPLLLLMTAALNLPWHEFTVTKESNEANLIFAPSDVLRTERAESASSSGRWMFRRTTSLHVVSVPRSPAAVSGHIWLLWSVASPVSSLQPSWSTWHTCEFSFVTEFGFTSEFVRLLKVIHVFNTRKPYIRQQIELLYPLKARSETTKFTC